MAGGWQKIHFFAKKKANIDPVGIPHIKEGFEQPAHNKSWAPQLSKNDSVDRIAQAHHKELNL